MASEWIIWQLADAAFPAGGLAHSGGLEAAYKWGELADGEALVEFLQTSLAQTTRAVAPLMRAAHQDAANLGAMDQLCQAFFNNHVANRASRAQGKAFLISAEGAFGLPEFRQWRDDVRRERLHGHFPPVFGAVTAALEIELGVATRLFLYIILRGLVSSAIRLGIVGPFEGQAIQFRLGPLADELSRRCAESSVDDITQTAPILELLQATQDRLYSRLFQS